LTGVPRAVVTAEREKEDRFLLHRATNQRTTHRFYDLGLYSEGLKSIRATYPDLEKRWPIVVVMLDKAIADRDFDFLFIIQLFAKLGMILSGNVPSNGLMEKLGDPKVVLPSMRRLSEILRTHSISIGAQHALASLPMPLETMAAEFPNDFGEMRAVATILLARLAGYAGALETSRQRGVPPLPREMVFQLGCSSATLAALIWYDHVLQAWALGPAPSPMLRFADQAVNAQGRLWRGYWQLAGPEEMDLADAEAVRQLSLILMMVEGVYHRFVFGSCDQGIVVRRPCLAVHIWPSLSACPSSVPTLSVLTGHFSRACQNPSLRPPLNLLNPTYHSQPLSKTASHGRLDFRNARVPRQAS
jgi:hypothetical protein